jgi:lipocalin
MEFQHQFPRVLPVIMLVCSLLSAPAQAQFHQQVKLVSTDEIGSFAFLGYSISLSADGNTAIVGGPGDNNYAGAGWVYVRSGGVWSQEAKLVGTGARGPIVEKGFSVSMSADGTTAIIGGQNDNNNVGAAWVFTRSGTLWSQQGTKLVATNAIGASLQGFSVSLSADGDTAIVGAPGDNTDANGDGDGAAWVYTRSGGVWSQQAKLVGTGATGVLPAEQGTSVSLSGDGNTAIVGAEEDNIFTGAAWVYTRSGGVWSQQAKLVGTGAIGGAFQGRSVSLSRDGNTAIVGGPSDDPLGAAWVFTRSGGVWSQNGPKLVDTGGIGSTGQGQSVSLTADGNIAILGGWLDNSGIGAAWVFTRSGGVWSQEAKLVGTGVLGLPVYQGISVALSGDGSTAMVGGPFDNNEAGAVWVYTQPVFAGTPGKANCDGKSVSALAKEYGGLNNAAAILGYSSVSALQDAIMAFCEA